MKAEKDFKHGGDIYSNISPTGQWLDYSANINPLGMPNSIKKAITAKIDSLVHYPDPRGRVLKQAISACYGIDKKNILLGNGAAELFYVYFHTKRPQKVLIPVPSFGEYEKAARASGADIEYIFLHKEQDFQLDLVQVRTKLAECQTVIIGNPNNPTGQLIAQEQVEQLVQEAQNFGVDVIVDESFLDFLSNRVDYSMLSQVEKYDNLLVISSLTKFYAIPGLRLGFGVTNEEYVKKMDFNKDTWNVNTLAQVAGEVALQDEEYQLSTRKYIAEAIENMFQALITNETLSRNFRIFPPKVNFVLLEIKNEKLTSGDFVAALQQKGVLVRDCSNYPGLNEKYIRIAIRTKEENSKMLEALENCLLEWEKGE